MQEMKMMRKDLKFRELEKKITFIRKYKWSI
jgi:hypothetical protein